MTKDNRQSGGSGWAGGLDARAKLVVLGVLSVAVWSLDTLAGLLLTCGACGLWLAFSGAAARKVLGGMKHLWTIFLFVALYYLWAGYYLGTGWTGALVSTALLCGKLAVLVATALWLYHSTPPMRVVDSLTSLLRPLEKLKVPVGELGFTVGLVIRSFPSSLTRIRELFANFRRQRRLASGGSFPRRFINTVRAVVDTMVCYMDYTLHEAELLSLSLQARGYNPFRPPRRSDNGLRAADWTFCLGSSAVVIAASLYL